MSCAEYAEKIMQKEPSLCPMCRAPSSSFVRGWRYICGTFVSSGSFRNKFIQASGRSIQASDSTVCYGFGARFDYMAPAFSCLYSLPFPVPLPRNNSLMFSKGDISFAVICMKDCGWEVSLFPTCVPLIGSYL
jgi:hypothetical protein